MSSILIVFSLFAALFITSCNYHSSIEEECIAAEWRADQSMKNGDYTKAESFYREALGKAQLSENVMQLPQVLQEQSELFLLKKMFPSAEASLRKSLEAYSAIERNVSPGSKTKSSVTRLQEGKIRSFERLANVLEIENNNAEAEGLLREALTLNRSIGGPVDDSLRISQRWATLLRKMHKTDGAENIEAENESASLSSTDAKERLWKQTEKFERGEEIQVCLQHFKAIAMAAKRFQNTDVYCAAKTREGAAELSLSRFPQAENSMRAALEVETSLSNTAMRKQNLAAAMSNVASCLHFEGKESDAIDIYKRGEQLDAGAVSKSLLSLMGVFGRSGDLKKARWLRDRIEKLAERDGEKNNALYSDLLVSSVTLGDWYDIHHDMKNFSIMIACANKIYPKVHEPTIPWQDMLNRLATVHFLDNQFGLAEKLLDKSILLNEKAYGKNSIGTARAVAMQANVYQAEHKNEEALACYMQACKIWAENKNCNLQLSTDLNLLAKLQLSLGKFTEAEKTLSLYEKSCGAESEPVASTLTQLADCCKEQKQYPQAEQYYKRALGIYQRKLKNQYVPREKTIQSKLEELAKK